MNAAQLASCLSVARGLASLTADHRGIVLLAASSATAADYQAGGVLAPFANVQSEVATVAALFTALAAIPVFPAAA